MKKCFLILLIILTFVNICFCENVKYIKLHKGPSHISLFQNKVLIGWRSNIYPYQMFDTCFAIYDGIKWIYYRYEDILTMFEDTNFIKQNKDLWPFVWCFDTKGNIWGVMGTLGTAVFKFDGSKISTYNIYLSWDFQDTFYFGVDLYHTRAIIVDKYDTPWIVVNKYGLKDDLYKFENGIFKRVLAYSYPGNAKAATLGLAVDSKNNLWHFFVDTINVFYTWGGHYRKIGVRGLFEDLIRLTNITISKFDIKYFLDNNSNIIIHDDKSWYKDTSYRSNFLCVDSSGNLWIKSLANGYLCKRTPTGEWTEYWLPNPPDSIGQLPGIGIIEADYQGRLWLVRGNYLVIFDPNDVDAVEAEIIEGLPDVWVRKLYPNPATEFARLEFFLDTDVSEQFTAGLYNYFGYKVMDLKPYFSYEPKSASGVIQFPVRGIPPGLYFVTLSAGNSHYARKLIIAE